uniref:SH2 domain-containing protein n=1 Tax=Rhabditophanes sp. KR3021 TaxID=114890 RepID=A0AC35TVY4_9BILA
MTRPSISAPILQQSKHHHQQPISTSSYNSSDSGAPDDEEVEIEVEELTPSVALDIQHPSTSRNQIVELLKKTIHNPMNPRAPSKGEINLSMTPSNAAQMGKGEVVLNNNIKVGNLEKIIMTHPIWYIRNIGRVEACNLLKDKGPGAFIVRSSTKIHSMALTIRLPTTFTTDNDHYLIETINGLVKLEGSPRSFKSLPLLIDYYCGHGEELHTRLEMPLAIQNCQSPGMLKSIALLGPDFWISDVAYLPSNDQPTMTPGINQNPMSSPSYATSSGYFTHNPDLFKAPYSSSTLNSSFYSSRGSPSSNTSLKSSALQSPRISSRSSSRTYKPTEKRTPSFLKSLFFGGSSSSVKDTTKKSSLNRSHSNQGQIPFTLQRPKDSHAAFNALAQCDYFTPFNNNALANGFEDRRRPTFKDDTLINDLYYQPPPRQISLSSGQLSKVNLKNEPPQNKKSSFLLNLKPVKINDTKNNLVSKKLNQPPSYFNSVRPKMHPSPNKTFGMSYQDNLMVPKCDNVKDEITYLSRVAEGSLRARQLAIQREISDITASITAKRLANHFEETRNCFDSGNDMKGPFGGGQKMLVQMTGKNGEKIKKVEASGVSTVAMRRGLNKAGSVETSKNMFTKFDENKKSEHALHRLSVPNLVDQKGEDYLDQHRAVTASVRALTAKIGRNQKTGELSTINEGLITPVVRRKQFSSPQKTLINHTTSLKEDPHSSIYHKVNIDPRQTTKLNVSPPLSSFPKSPQTSNKWCAVNAEMKSRQKIARLSPLSYGQGEGVGGSSSEYTPITDFGTRQSIISNTSDIILPTKDHQVVDEDSVSVAGTVFNEPWDSNIWENLLDLAKTVDSGSSNQVTPQVERATLNFDSAISTTNTITSLSQSSGSSMYSELSKPTSPHLKMHSGGNNKIPKSPNDNIILRIGNKMLDDTLKLVPVLPHQLSAGEEAKSFNRSRFSSIPNGDESLCVDMSESQTLYRKSVGVNKKGSFKNNNILNIKVDPAKDVSPIEESKAKIQMYIEHLSMDGNTIFGATLQRFIECTFEANETCPNTVIRNVRQFLNGMKNYLVKNGEKDLHEVIRVESTKLSQNCFLDIDAILETGLYKLLLKPVKNLLYRLSLNDGVMSREHKMVTANLIAIKNLSSEGLGLSSEMEYTGNMECLEMTKICFKKMQQHYSPFKKLDNFLRALEVCVETKASIESSTGMNLMFTSTPRTLPSSDDLIRIIMFMLAKGNAVTCDLDTWYMWELLPSRVLTSGDSAFYLTSLSSAIQLLKDPECMGRIKTDLDIQKCDRVDKSIYSTLGCLSPRMDVLTRVAVPDEQEGTIKYHTFPYVPHMSVGKLGRIIASRFSITFPDDHGLYILFDGYENRLNSNESLDEVIGTYRASNKNYLFAYKRHEAKIAWPTLAMNGGSVSVLN